MINPLKKLFSMGPDLSKIQEQYKEIYATIEEMELSFSKGGAITWEQLGTYEISTGERSIPYPTGKDCMSYRLPDQDGKRVFYTVCVSNAGQYGQFGWHWHPKSKEINIQLVGIAKHNGELLAPFSVTVFEPGTKHDYILPSGGALITYFEKTIK